MVRNYKRKTDRASSYTPQQLQEAIKAVKNGSISAYAASKLYKIPRATIVNRVNDRKGLKSNTLGRSTILSKDVEEMLAKNLHTLEKYGFGLTRKELLEAVGQYVVANDLKTPFKDGVPGEDWFIRFKRDHKLSVKKPQPVEYARKKACCPAVVYPYFDLLEKTILELGLADKPTHIWNADETSFSQDPSKSRVVGLQGYTSTRTIASPGKTNTTVLLACNAAGEKAPPLIVYKGKNLWDQWISEDGYPGTVYAATKNGWMDSQVFEKFFDQDFLLTVGDKRPILLIYDGHATHVGLNIIEKARENNITILKLPPHTSDTLQPLDLAVNKSFKDKWDVALVKWQRLNIGKALPKKEFSRILGEIWTQIDPQVCMAGFRKAGIYPLNKNAVPESKFDQVQLAEWRERHRHYQPESTSQPEPTAQSESPSLLDSTLQCESPSQLDSTSQLDCTSHPGSTSQVESKEIMNPGSESPGKLSEIALAAINKTTERPQILKRIHTTLNKCLPVTRIVAPRIENETKELNTTMDSGVHERSKITILDNQLVSSNVTFEQVLLNYIKPAGNLAKPKKRKIATGAEVITHDEVYKRCMLIEKEKEQKLQKQEEKKAKSKQTQQKEKQTTKKLIEKKNQEKRQYSKNRKKRPILSSSSSETENEIMYDDLSDIDSREFFENLLREEENMDQTENSERNEIYDGEKIINEVEKDNIYLKHQKQNTEKENNEKEETLHGHAKNSKIRRTRYMNGHSQENIKLTVKPEKEKNVKERILQGDNKENMNKIRKQDKEETKKDDKRFEHGNETENIDMREEGEKEEKNEVNEDTDAQFSKNDWLLVKFCTKKSVKHYVGVVLEINEGVPIVKYTRKRSKTEGETVFTFPLIDDISELTHRVDIVSKLPKPAIDRRGKIFFKMSFKNFNIQ